MTSPDEKAPPVPGSGSRPATGGKVRARVRARARACAFPAGVERFLEIYLEARLLPYRPADSELMASLERCVGCGNCQAACPVVGALADHPYPGPRTIGTSLSRSLPEFWTAADIAGFCTTCMACEQACPGDVPIYRAILMIRAKNYERRAREGEDALGRVKRLVVDFFAEGKLAQATRWGATLQGLAYRKTAGGEMKARVALPFGTLANRVIPPLARRSLVEEFGEPVAGEIPSGPKVAVFAGCLYNHAYTDTGRSLIGVLRRHAREVIVPTQQACCGAPVFYSGDLPATRRLAVRNARVFEAAGADFVVTACASCGDVLTREYPALFETPAAMTLSPETAAEAAAVRSFAAKVRDVHAFLTDEVSFRAPRAAPPGATGRGSAENRTPPTSPGVRGASAAAGRPPQVITIHDPCHLNRGQGLAREVRELARTIAGVKVKEMDEPSACCGGAGSFSLDHYEVAAAIRKGKVARIDATGADTVVTGCPSCRMHISDGLEQAGKGRPVRHLVDLLEEAYLAESR